MQRRAKVKRETAETYVSVEINIDGSGKFEISTGIPFFDHMLSAMARHATFDLTVDARGDVDVEAHHTIEDVAIVLGNGIAEALKDRKNIVRYGYALVPMDDSCA
jgi:imidazoleglycerol-phosphate dehydratase